MITYKVTTGFQAEWTSLYEMLFPDVNHDASMTTSSVAYFSFNDDTVTPADLGPLVKVERVNSIPFHSP